MTALFIYLGIALGFSFLCSIAEAVLLSVTTAYISVLEQEGKPAARQLQKLKTDIDAPLAAILSLNTIAHTVGAAGVGAQATQVFGSGFVGITSAILTLLILVFSEIIPKTLGSYYWRQLAPSIAYVLKYLIIALYPFVLLSRQLTRKIAAHPTLDGFSRAEFSAMATLGHQEGQLEDREAKILQNLFRLRDTRVCDVMTPNTVIFSLPAGSSVDYFFNKHDDKRFSRIPIYEDTTDHITGFVLRSDLLTAQARGNNSTPLSNYRRDIIAVLDKFSLLTAFELFLEERAQIMLVIDEYGSHKGLLSLEDVLETLMGLEIIDEGDTIEDMQKLARRQWRKRAEKMGLNIEEHKQ